jgi:hypothetical protein
LSGKLFYYLYKRVRFVKSFFEGGECASEKLMECREVVVGARALGD